MKSVFIYIVSNVKKTINNNNNPHLCPDFEFAKHTDICRIIWACKQISEKLGVTGGPAAEHGQTLTRCPQLSAQLRGRAASDVAPGLHLGVCQ